MDDLIQKTLDSLRRRRVPARFFSEPGRAKDFLLEQIPMDATVGVGNSRTVKALGVVEALRERGNVVFDKTAPGLTEAAVARTKRQALLADVFLSGANAISADGRIVNIDHSGNRVAAIAFGPRRVFILAGVNKVVPDLDAAIQRARNVAAPLNARRSGHAPPCLTLGSCVDCASPERICFTLSITEGQADPERMTVVLVAAKLGF